MRNGKATSAIIFVDNMRIGGYQRLALDQAYALSDMGLRVNIFVLSEPKDWVLNELERDLIGQRNITIQYISNLRIKMIIKFLNMKELDSSILVISHSLRATFSLRMVKILILKRFEINTTIHQLPGLTDSIQRLKRFLYCQMTDKLFCFSKSVYDDWHIQFGSPLSLYVRMFSKKIELLRNGIFLDRLPSITLNEVEDSIPRIVFLGRPTFWKGLATISKLIDRKELNGFHFLFIVPDERNAELDSILRKLADRAEIIKGRTIREYEPRQGDVHIYPANYGSGVKRIEGISLNCLEMGACGIPTLLTQGGMYTWPELVQSRLFHETNWENVDVVSSLIQEISQLIILSDEIEYVREIVDIRNQINFFLETTCV